MDNWGEIKDSSYKNNRGLKRRLKEQNHYSKNKSSKRAQLHECNRAKQKSLVNRYMSGNISDDELEN